MKFVCFLSFSSQRQTRVPGLPAPPVAGEGGGVPLQARGDPPLLPLAKVVREMRPRQASPQGKLSSCHRLLITA